MKKYLIIGGAGFIGSCLSKTLLDLGNNVIVIDGLPPKEPDLKIKYYQVNIKDSEKVQEVFEKEKPNMVYYLAGPINLRKPIDDPLFLKEMDFLTGIKITLDTCKNFNVEKLIFVSSGGAIYQDAKLVPTKEEYLAHPTTLYGLANLAIEKYILSYAKINRINAVIARLANVYGPAQWKSGFIPAMILKMLNRESPIINDTGRQTRDFIYINDAVLALVALEKKNKSEVYNIGGGKEISLNKVFSLINKLLGVKIKPTYQKLSNLETKRSFLDIKKIKKEFGWTPKTDIESGLLKTIAFMKHKT